MGGRLYSTAMSIHVEKRAPRFGAERFCGARDHGARKPRGSSGRARRFLVVSFFLGVWSMGCGAKPSPNALLRRGRRLERRGKLAKACAAYEGVWKRAKTQKLMLQGVRRYVRCLHARGRLSLARQAVQTFHSKRRVRGVGAWIQAYFAGYVELLSGPGHMEKAMAAFRQAAKKSGGHFEPVYRLALLHMQREEFSKAEKLLREALGRAPDNPGVLISLARCLAVRGELDAALVKLRKAATQTLSRGLVRQGRAVSGWIAQAAAPMSRADLILYRRASKMMEKKLPGQATQLLEESLESRPGAPTLHRLLGMAHLRLGNEALGVVSLTRALKANPYDGMSAAILGVFHLEKKMRERAEAYLIKACRMHPFSLLAHRSLGYLLLKSGRPNEAENRLKQAVNLSLRKPKTLRIWALALRKLGRRGEAIQALEESVRKKPKDYDAWMMLGDLYMEKYGDKGSVKRSERLFRLAKRAYKRALKIRPGDLKAKGRLHGLDPEEALSGFGKE